MKIRYTITTKSCPSCGHIFSRSDDLWLYILLIITFPISIPTLIAFHFLSEYVFLSPQIPSIGNPIKICPKCGSQIKSGKTTKDNLSKLELLNHKFKWLFRLSYLFGGIAILFLLGFIIGLFDYDNTVLYFLYISLFLICLIFIIALIYRKKLSIVNKEKSETEAKKLLAKTGKTFFIKYYNLLKKQNTIDVIDAIEENYSEVAKEKRIANAKKIFNKNLQTEALNEIIKNEDEAASPEIIVLSKLILIKEMQEQEIKEQKRCKQHVEHLIKPQCSICKYYINDETCETWVKKPKDPCEDFRVKK